MKTCGLFPLFAYEAGQEHWTGRWLERLFPVVCFSRGELDFLLFLEIHECLIFGFG